MKWGEKSDVIGTDAPAAASNVAADFDQLSQRFWYGVAKLHRTRTRLLAVLFSIAPSLVAEAQVVPPTPTAITLAPASATIPDNAPAGTVLSTATVTMSDCSQFTGTLTSSDTSGFFATLGLNIVTARALTPADDGTHSTVITASQGGSPGSTPATAVPTAVTTAVLTTIVFSPPGFYPGFYVATNGSDSNAGTFAAPFASLGKCQTAMQHSTIKTCYIRAGTYTPAATGTGCYGAVALILGNSDVGETWSYYPRDGYDSAIIDEKAAGPAGSSEGLYSAFCIVPSGTTPPTSR